MYEIDSTVEDKEVRDADELLAPLDRMTGDRHQSRMPLGPDQLLEIPLQLSLQPRSYQRDAVRSWLDADGRGVIVLPTGAGKTVVAMMAIEAVGARTLVVVPTIELLEQWRLALVGKLG